MNETDTVDVLLALARGPLFRFTFALMVLGLLRLVALTIYRSAMAWRAAGDKKLNWKIIRQRTLWWLFPFTRFHRTRMAYSIISFVFHIGLIVTPIFLFAHVRLWEQGLGISWPTLPPPVADVLTVIAIVGAIALFVGRVGHPVSRTISRPEDFAWPLVLALPFISGLLASHTTICPLDYRVMMLIHVLSAEVIFVLIPFSKIAHCVLVPFSQFVSDLGWHFPQDAGRQVAKTLNKESVPI